MKDVTIGQYYPVNSPIHRLDPRIKLLSVIVYIVSIFFIKKFAGFALLAVFLLCVVFTSRVPLAKVLKSLRAIIFLMLFTVILTALFYSANSQPLWQWKFIKIYKEGLINAAMLGLRLLFLVMGPSLLTLTTTPVELTDAFESLLKPLALIRLPIHELAIIMSIALRFIPTLTEETERIINAQKARCASFDTGNIFKRAKAMLPVLIPLFVSAYMRAAELADAMDSRCYRGAKGRTRLRVFKLRLGDFIAAFIMLLLLFVVLVLRYNWFGWAFVGMLI